MWAITPSPVRAYYGLLYSKLKLRPSLHAGITINMRHFPNTDQAGTGEKVIEYAPSYLNTY